MAKLGVVLLVESSASRMTTGGFAQVAPATKRFTGCVLGRGPGERQWAAVGDERIATIVAFCVSGFPSVINHTRALTGHYRLQVGGLRGIDVRERQSVRFPVVTRSLTLWSHFCRSAELRPGPDGRRTDKGRRKAGGGGRRLNPDSLRKARLQESS